MNRKEYYRKKYGDIPDNILNALISLDRHEEYLKRKDPLGNAILFGDESELYRSNIIMYFSCEDEATKPKFKCPYLSEALELLERRYPTDYDLLMNKYFSDNPKSADEIAAEHGVKKATVYQRISTARLRLRRNIGRVKHKENFWLNHKLSLRQSNFLIRKDGFHLVL